MRKKHSKGRRRNGMGIAWRGLLRLRGDFVVREAELRRDALPSWSLVTSLRDGEHTYPFVFSSDASFVLA